jgi:hypothetical protein
VASFSTVATASFSSVVDNLGAGKPPTRTISSWISARDDLPGTLSPDFVSRTLRGDVPRWPHLESLVCVLVDNQVVGHLTLTPALKGIHKLWKLTQVNATSQPVPAPDLAPAPDRGPVSEAKVRQIPNWKLEPLLEPDSEPDGAINVARMDINTWMGAVTDATRQNAAELERMDMDTWLETMAKAASQLSAEARLNRTRISLEYDPILDPERSEVESRDTRPA